MPNAAVPLDSTATPKRIAVSRRKPSWPRTGSHDETSSGPLTWYGHRGADSVLGFIRHTAGSVDARRRDRKNDLHHPVNRDGSRCIEMAGRDSSPGWGSGRVPVSGGQGADHRDRYRVRLAVTQLEPHGPVPCYALAHCERAQQLRRWRPVVELDTAGRKSEANENDIKPLT